MKCSVELPVANLVLSDYFDYDFVIASTCVEYPRYKEWYMAASERFMILDNGSFETGEAMNDSDYIALARELMPDVLVIPDVYKDPVASLDRFHSFLDTWKTAPIEEVSLMGVIQAGGSVTMAHALGILYQTHQIEWIGVPYACELDRYTLISNHPEWKRVHILGLPVLSEAFGLSLLPNVVTIDSSLPVKSTKEGKSLETLRASTYATPDDITLDASLLRRNLEIFHKACHEGVICQCHKETTCLTV